MILIHTSKQKFRSKLKQILEAGAKLVCPAIVFCLGCLMTTNGWAQNSAPKRSIKAAYVEDAPKIDGQLKDKVWQKAAVATSFVENTPEPFTSPSQKTEVKVVYTTEGIYVGAKMYDSAPDSILKQLSVRDDNNVNADNFTIYIDGMLTQQSDFTFAVTAAGVQIDQNDGDAVWDAVWRSKVQIVEDGWVAEVEIPYSQLRFPKSKEQTWGINFSRKVRRSREVFYWAPIDPTKGNVVQQYGHLKGIERIKPPVRLSFTPYLAGYINHSYDGATNTNTVKPTFSAGADMKYGINESFTLDVALVPDFGDVQSDNLVYNLSPFEIYYAERRPFFTEGVDLFAKADLFYSRRIGSTPARFSLANSNLDSTEFITRSPEKPYLINALKVSGRTKKGLGLGLFNAVTAPSFATIENDSGDTRKFRTEGFTNYNVIVADQQFWQHSSISIINTSVVRFGGFTDAIATGTQFKIADKKNMWGVAGSAAMSHRFLDTLQHQKRYQNGYRYDIAFNKFSGNFTFNIGQRTMSKDYNINDMGYVTWTNYMNTYANFNYNVYKPTGAFLRMWSSLNIAYNRLYNPNVFTSLSIGGSWGGTLKNFLSIGADARIEPMGNYNYFEARTDGRVWAKPVWTRIGAWFSSDYRKAFALDGDFSYRRFWGQGAWSNSDVIEAELQPLIRFSDRFNMILKVNITWRHNSLGYVTKSVINGYPDESIIFGARKRQDMESTINANYLFNNKISLSLRVRHYWARVDYQDYFILNEDGSMGETTYVGNHNTNYNAFNIDLIFRWRFAPGSELNVVWKNVVLDYGTQPSYNYFDNFGNMFRQGQNNQFSIKALYYLDFFKLLGKNRKRGVRLD